MASVEWDLHWREPVGDLAVQAVTRAAEITRGRVRENIQHAGRVDSGAMRDTISIATGDTSPTHPSRIIYSPMPYTIFQEKGTDGSDAPPGGVLVFKPKGSATRVFTTHTAPIQGAHMFRDALQAVSRRDFL